MMNLDISHFKSKFIGFWLTVYCVGVFAQEPNIILSARIQENNENLEIIELFKNYIKSPFNYPNSYWNADEQVSLGPGFNLGINMFQGLTSEDFLVLFDFYILNIEQIEKNSLSVNILVQSKNGLENGSSVWCILKLIVIKENGRLVFQNNYLTETKSWKSKKTKNLVFIYPPVYKLNEKEIKRADNFITELKKIFQNEGKTPLKYYLCPNIDHLGLLQNFSYYFAGITTGITKLNKFIMTTKGEFHAHEIVHLVLPQNANRNFMLEEGLAEYFGTKRIDPKNYSLNQQLIINEIITKKIPLAAFFDGTELSFDFNYRYGFGSLICDFIAQKYGNKGLVSIANADSSSNQKLLEVILKMYEIEANEFIKKFDEFIMMKVQY